jgi:Carboxypeptidase regulatory-like domain
MQALVHYMQKLGIRTGALISGSSVTLVNTATGATQKAISNGEGVFNFPVVPVGQYELDVTASGFTPYKNLSVNS